MKITSANYPDFVANMQIKWREGFERVPLMAKKLYDVQNNDLLITDHSGIENGGFARRKAEGDNYYKGNPVQNYRKTMTKYRVGEQEEITWEMRKYDKYKKMGDVIKMLGEKVSQRMEIDLSHRLTFGTATTYTDMDGETVSITTGDGLQLFYSLHTVPGSSTTFRNRIANNPAISKGGLEAAELLFSSQMIDTSGGKIVVKPDTIITTDDPNTVNTVLEFLRSTAAPEGAHSGIVNNYKSKYNHIVLPYLATTNVGAYDSTKAKYWMLASVAHTDAVCEISEMPHMIAPAAGQNSEEFDNDDWKFKGSAAYGIEIIDPRWIVMSSGDGTA